MPWIHTLLFDANVKEEEDPPMNPSTNININKSMEDDNDNARLREGHEKISSSSTSPLSSSLYSSMKLPYACLNEHDGCDEAELIARAKRCEEILKLSQQAKEAEAERVRIANIKPLVWAKPTFELDSDDTDDTTAAAADENKAAEEESQADDSLGIKRKEHQEAEATGTIQHYSSYHRERFFFKRRRKATQEEVQAFVDFTNKWIPSPKGVCKVNVGNDDEGETEGKESKSDTTTSSS